MNDAGYSERDDTARAQVRMTSWQRWWRVRSRIVRSVGLTLVAIDRYAWVLVSALAAAALILGTWGFRLHHQVSDMRSTWWDALYLALQLFTMNSGAVSGPVEWQLEIARFLAPVVAAGAAARALAVFFYERFQGGVLRLFGHDHIVICGVGRKGAGLVEELRRNGHWVVVIEKDARLPDLDRCRALGATVLIGSASDPWVLRRACIWRARALAAVTGTDGANVETAVRAHQLNAHRTHGTLRCVVHVVNRDLRDMLTRTGMASRRDEPFELLLFNVYERCAQVMLDELAATRGSPIGTGSEHLIIVGFGEFGRALAREAWTRWQASGSRAELVITIVDIAAEALSRHHVAAELRTVGCTVEFLARDVHQPAFVDGVYSAVTQGRPATAIFVSLGDDALGMYAAMRLQELLRERDTPVFVRMSERAGLGAALRDSRYGQGFIDGVRPVYLLEMTCRADLVLGGGIEAR